MKNYKTSLGTYEAMTKMQNTCEFLGSYNYTMEDGEVINGEWQTIIEDEYTPIVKVECKNGYFCVTDYAKSVEKLLDKNEVKVNKKAFVNGYGEKTERNITCSTYEKAQKRMSKEIMSFIGGR